MKAHLTLAFALLLFIGAGCTNNAPEKIPAVEMEPEKFVEETSVVETEEEHTDHIEVNAPGFSFSYDPILTKSDENVDCTLWSFKEDTTINMGTGVHLSHSFPFEHATATGTPLHELIDMSVNVCLVDRAVEKLVEHFDEEIVERTGKDGYKIWMGAEGSNLEYHFQGAGPNKTFVIKHDYHTGHYDLRLATEETALIPTKRKEEIILEIQKSFHVTPFDVETENEA